MDRNRTDHRRLKKKKKIHRIFSPDETTIRSTVVFDRVECFYFYYYIFFFFPPSGVVDQETRPAHTHGRPVDLHERPAFPVAALGRVGRVDAPDHVAADQGLGDVRVSSEHRTENQPRVPVERSQ